MPHEDDSESNESPDHVLGDGAGVHVGAAETSDQPPIDFGNFVLSMAHGVLVALGLVEHPELGEPGERDLDTARQSIQILEMLQEKTVNNLDPEEEKLLSSLLYELRMSYVDASAQTVEPGA